MDPVFLWLEATRFSIWLRESTSVLAYPAILSAHAIGMGLAAGINGALALRLLGVAPGVPVVEMRRFVPVMWFGFWLNAASGVLLLLAYPTKALTNPVFYLKIGSIALAMWIFVTLRRQVLVEHAAPGVDAGRQRLKALAAGSLLCWTTAITSGRLLAYTAHRMMADWPF
jgi:hypothetical protein